MAENIEKDSAESMSKSQGSGRGKWLDVLFNNRAYGNRANSNSGNSSSSSSGQGGDEWTAERYKNHNKYKENEHRRANESADSEMIRHNTNEDARFIRKNTSRDARHLRDKDTMEHAAKFGQMANMDLSTPKQRKQITFRDTPVSETNPGKGKGAQGTSKQQTSGKGAAAGRVVGAALGGAVTKNPKGVTVGGALGAKVGDAIEKKVANRGSKSAVKPGTTAGAADSYITPSKGKKLAPETKAQNAAARTYR